MSYYYEKRLAAQLGAHLDETPVVLFDGDCRLCSALVDFVLAHEKNGRITFCAVQTPAGQSLLAYFDFPAVDWDSVVFLEKGQAYLRSEAFVRIAGYLKPPWIWLQWGRLAPLSLRDLVYKGVARNRYRLLGTRPVCHVRGNSHASRFVESVGELCNRSRTRN